MSFQDALQEAEATGKLIFLDGYTSWCAPCKMMNTTVFTDPEVGHFFNEHFINVKFDMEKGEGRELLKRYGMQVIPVARVRHGCIKITVFHKYQIGV